MRNALGREDADNLRAIIRHLIDTQGAATPARVPLVVQLPRRGQVVHFTREIQVRPDELAGAGAGFASDRQALRPTRLLTLDGEAFVPATAAARPVS